MKIRVATAEDAKSIQMIYAPYVEKTAITFEYGYHVLRIFSRES